MLVIFGIWRHIYRRFPLRYDPLYWARCFLWNVTARTYRLSQAIDAPYLITIPHWFFYAAPGAWFTAFAGLVHHLLRRC